MPLHRITPRRFLQCLAAGAFAAWAGGALAAAEANRQQAGLEALARAQGAVLGVQVQATQGAQSGRTLGRTRSGTGVVIGDDGLVLTIGYLILEAESIQLVLPEGRTVPARPVGYDLATGFGLVRPLLPMRGIAPAPLGSMAGLQAGEPLLAATGGEDGGMAVTQAVGQRPFSGYWEYHIESALFTSPPIANHSGAAVFNGRGELLGIGSLFVGDAAGAGGPPGNMFVPVDLLRPILPELLRTGSTAQSQRPWLGLSSAEQGGRVQVVRVSPDSPAQASGLRPGDFVLGVDGTPVRTLEAFYKRLWDRPSPETEVRLTVMQGAELREVTLKPVNRMTTLARPGGI